jgi:G3E family GTPase
MSSLPVTILTGFLGSGKTTLLQKLLKTEGGAGVVVLINEFGEIGLDHLLVRTMAGPAIVLQNGCICCSVRSDLRNGLRDLVDARDKGEIPAFDRILVETTGLADPVPIVQSLTADPMLRHQLRLANLVTTVDAHNGLNQLDARREALRQAALADRLVLTKSDICKPEEIAGLRRRLEDINPTAPVIDPHDCDDLWGMLMRSDALDPQRKSEEARLWFSRLPAESGPPFEYQAADSMPLAHAVQSFVIQTELDIDWTAFAVWLSALVHRYGSKILRIKGLLNVQGYSGPVLLNAVQNFIHPPLHLDSWPDGDRTSRLVFIAEGLDVAATRQSLLRYLESSAPAGKVVRKVLS